MPFMPCHSFQAQSCLFSLVMPFRSSPVMLYRPSHAYSGSVIPFMSIHTFQTQSCFSAQSFLPFQPSLAVQNLIMHFRAPVMLSRLCQAQSYLLGFVIHTFQAQPCLSGPILLFKPCHALRAPSFLSFPFIL